jgi:hypothetical protein
LLAPSVNQLLTSIDFPNMPRMVSCRKH